MSTQVSNLKMEICHFLIWYRYSRLILHLDWNYRKLNMLHFLSLAFSDYPIHQVFWVVIIVVLLMVLLNVKPLKAQFSSLLFSFSCLLRNLQGTLLLFHPVFLVLFDALLLPLGLSWLIVLDCRLCSSLLAYLHVWQFIQGPQSQD